MKFTYNYLGFGNCNSQCILHVSGDKNRTYICFEESPDNLGTSVTNMSEELATQIVNRFKLNPRHVDFFEYYRDHETFDNVKYIWENNIARNPRWNLSDNKNKMLFNL